MLEIIRPYLIASGIFGFIYAYGIVYYQTTKTPELSALLEDSDKRLYGYFKNGAILFMIHIIATIITSALLPVVLIYDFLEWRRNRGQ